MRAALLVVACSAAAALAAEPVTLDAGARSALALTLYGDQGPALVRDTRRATLPAGPVEIRFDDVPATVDARTLALRVADDPQRLQVRAQRFRFDLASPDRLIARWVGHDVELEETDERLRTKVTPATLLAAGNGLVVRIGDRIVPNPPGRLRLPPLDDVATRPTLAWQAESASAGPATLEASYATGGLAWAADYVAWLDAAQTTMDLTAWATLTNDTDVRFADATLALVAGQVHRVGEPERKYVGMQMRAMAAPAAAPEPAESRLTEYHEYTVEGRVGLAPHATTQIPLLAARGVGVQKRFVAAGAAAWLRQPVRDVAQDVPVHVVLGVDNRAKNHLGRPLPAGVVRFYAPDAHGAPTFVGEDRLRHLPVDDTAELEVGEAFDVRTTRRQTDFKKLDVQPWSFESAWEIVVRNRRKDAVTVEVREPVDGEWKVVASSLPAKKLDARTLAFDVPVPAGGETTLIYRVQVGR
jgi:hypothetical protein